MNEHGASRPAVRGPRPVRPGSLRLSVVFVSSSFPPCPVCSSECSFIAFRFDWCSFFVAIAVAPGTTHPAVVVCREAVASRRTIRDVFCGG